VRLRLDILAVAVLAAVTLHVAAVLATKRVPLVGTGRLAAEASEDLRNPEVADVSPRDPLRVTLGVAQRGPASAPGRMAVLDPASVRRAPGLGAEWPDRAARLEAARDLFMPPPGLPAEGTEPLGASPTGTTIPSWADREVADIAVPLSAPAAARRLPRRFLPPPPLSSAAEATRPAPESLRRDLSLPSPPALPPAPPDWPEPLRAITLPEIFVDVLEAGR
jgi:hypothetical protein